MDKVVGWALRQNLLPLSGTVLQVSGRTSFELVEKAAMAGIPVVSAVSAPSSLAADLAGETGVTLVGFGHSRRPGRRSRSGIGRGACRKADRPVRIWAAHRVGMLEVGDPALVCAVSAAHRGQAFEVCSQLADRIKARVPF